MLQCKLTIYPIYIQPAYISLSQVPLQQQRPFFFFCTHQRNFCTLISNLSMQLKYQFCFLSVYSYQYSENYQFYFLLHDNGNGRLAFHPCIDMYLLEKIKEKSCVNQQTLISSPHQPNQFITICATTKMIDVLYFVRSQS